MQPKTISGIIVAATVALLATYIAKSQPTNIPTVTQSSIPIDTNLNLVGSATNFFKQNSNLLNASVSSSSITGAVATVFGRDGIVVAVSNDYSADKIGVAFTATNHTPTANDVLAHLMSLDDALADVGAGFSDSEGLRSLLSDETGTGAAVFAGGNIGAATATTPSADDNDTSVATTAYVQTELGALSGDWITSGTVADARIASTIMRDNEGVLLAGGTMTGDLSVPNEAYGVGWNGSVEVPTKDAVYDKIESLVLSGGGAVDSVFGRTGVVMAVAYDYSADQIGVGFSPTNYNATATNVLAHLMGLDNQLEATFANFISTLGGTMTGDLIVPDEAYDATSWNGNNEVPTKNAIRDKIESMGGGGSGDVVGPASSTAYEVAIFDDTTGKLLGLSGITASNGVLTVGTLNVDLLDVDEYDFGGITNFVGSGLTNNNGTLEATSGGGGTVTSVALSAPAEFSVSGSPVTTSGTLTFSKANQNANLIYAGPSSGGAAAPTFRALATNDMPSGVTLDDEAAAAYEPLNANKYQATNTFLTTLAGVGAATGSGNVMRTRTGVYRELWVGAGAMTPSTTNAAATGTMSGLPSDASDTTIDVFDFDDTTSESVQFVWSPPDAWDRGTVKAKLFYSQVSATTGTNVLSLAAKAVSSGDSYVGALGTAVTTTNVVADSTNKLTVVTTGALTVGGSPALHDLLIFKVSRLPADDYDTASGDLRLHGVKLQYIESTTEPSAW